MKSSPKKIIRKIVPYRIFKILRDLFYPEKIDILEKRLHSIFISQYQALAAPQVSQKTSFANAEYKVYSKHGNDGILAFVFSKIGVTNRTFVEIGVEDGTECNTANLSINFGWNGLLVDAEEVWIQKAEGFYKKKLGTSWQNVKFATSFVTRENINQTIKNSGISGEIDLLSIDIDSNDYWVWNDISVINPRVVVMEYNAAFGPTKSQTIKYDPKFHYQETYKENPLYFGVSLSALTKLAHQKGYILAGCDTHGHDAFFIRHDIAKDKFLPLSPIEAFYANPYTHMKFGDTEMQYAQIEHLDFDEI